MNERQLRALKLTVEYGTTVRAAQVLGVTQPAVSQLINGLEKDLGFAVFERRQGKIQVTPQGRAFLTQAQNVLDSFAEARRAAEALRGYSNTHLQIGCTVGFAMSALPRALSGMRARFPELTFSLQAQSSVHVQEMLDSHIFDMGVFEVDPSLPVGGEQSFVEVPVFCTMRHDDALAQKEVIEVADLAGRELAALYQKHPSSQQLMRAFEGAGHVWEPVLESNLFASLCQFSIDSGVVAFSDRNTPEVVGQGQLVCRRFVPDVSLKLSIARARVSDHAAHLDALEAEIRAVLGGL